MTTGAEVPSNLFVVLMGISTVFLGLICIILIIELMTGLTRKLGSSEPKATAPAAPVAPVAPVATPAPTVETPIANREELVAAVCAAVAEELGTDVSALRVVSFRKV
jgi:sodium pump decarboxylase gamma subunit